MRYQRAIGIFVVPLLLAFCTGPAPFAQQSPPPQSAPSAQQTPASVTPTIPSYPDSSAGLEKLMKDMLELDNHGDANTLAPYLQSLVLSNPDAWFKSIFGDTVGAQLALSYEPTAKGLPQAMAATLKNLRQERFADHFEAVDSNKPCAAPSFMVAAHSESETKALGPSAVKLLVLQKEHQPMYAVWFRKGRSVTTMAFFVYDEGAFRYIGKPEIPDSVAAQGPQPQVKSGGTVQAAKLIHWVGPVYPVVAKEDHVEGAVTLHASIGSDGSIQNLSYVSGPQALVYSAMHAVKQWKYQPTMLNGTPVSVDTCITVTFNLGWR